MTSPSNGDGLQYLAASKDDDMVSPAPKSNGTGQPERYEPTFTGLPTELKRMIVRDADDLSLPNLRLTSRELNEIASEPFGERRLAERRFMFTKYSMQGLVDLTAHPVFGPCVRKILFSTYRIANVEDWLESAGQVFPEAKRQAKWKVIQAPEENVNRSFEKGKVFRLLAQVLSNLKKHGQRVRLGIFDDVVHRGTDRAVLRKAYGFDEIWRDVSPLTDLTDQQWVSLDVLALSSIGYVVHHGKFPDPPLELDLERAPRSGYSDLGHVLCGSVMENETLHRDVDVYVRVAFDWTFRFFRLDGIQRHLVFDFRGTVVETCKIDEVDPKFVPDVYGAAEVELRFIYGSGNCSVYSPCLLGDFNNAIGAEKVFEIHMESFATEAPYLAYGIVGTGAEKLQKLTLIDVHLFGPGSRGFIDENDCAWPYLGVFRELLRDNCPNLRSLVLERVYYHAEDKPMVRAVITEQRREWIGKNGVLSGLASLVSEMTTLDEEQQERWFEREIDADGNEPA